MASILRTAIFLDIEIASIFDFISGHTMLITSTMQSFTNSTSEKGLLPFAISCAKTKLAFVAASWVDENLIRVRCCCFSFLTISAALMFSSCLENCGLKSLCFATKCLWILYSSNTAHVSLQIKQATFDWPVTIKKYFSVHSLLKTRHLESTCLLIQTDGFITGDGKLQQLHSHLLFS